MEFRIVPSKIPSTLPTSLPPSLSSFALTSLPSALPPYPDVLIINLNHCHQALYARALQLPLESARDAVLLPAKKIITTKRRSLGGT